MSQKERGAYVQAVLRLYRALPETVTRPRRADRRLAGELHRRGISLEAVEIAFRLAVARRRARPPDAPPLPPVRSLHYFLPVVDELPPGPPPQGYLDYLRDVVPDIEPATDPITPPNARRPTRSLRYRPRQPALPLDVGDCTENDVSW